MKFLHLSDLHIGKSVSGRSMIEEQARALEQAVGCVKAELAAAVVIAGDVYDRAVPSVDAVRVFDDFLTELAGENVAVMLISGNHDSPERLNYASRLLSEKRLFLCGAFDGALKKVVLADEYGDVVFWLLPFIKPLSVRGMFEGREIESYDDAIAAALETADIDYTRRNVLVSHQFYTKAGVALERSESEIDPVGGLDAVDVRLVERFDYIALGHLHGPQSVGAEHIRYCGSPIKYSLSECRQKKSVTMVELGEKGDLKITLRPLIPIHDMRQIKGPFEKLVSDEISALGDINDYLYVTLTDEETIIDPHSRLRGVYPNIMHLGFENSRTSSAGSAAGAAGESIENLSHYELFCKFFDEMGFTMSKEQAEITRELLETEGEE